MRKTDKAKYTRQADALNHEHTVDFVYAIPAADEYIKKELERINDLPPVRISYEAGTFIINPPVSFSLAGTYEETEALKELFK